MIEIKGKIKGVRVSSKELDEKIQSAVSGGKHSIRVVADGQHGIGGRQQPAQSFRLRSVNSVTITEPSLAISRFLTSRPSSPYHRSRSRSPDMR